jgi:hypothetical protein
MPRRNQTFGVAYHLKIFKLWNMSDEQKEIIQMAVYKLKVEHDKLLRTPKRGQTFNHEHEIARVEGKIAGLGLAVLLLTPADPNPIEQ